MVIIFLVCVIIVLTAIISAFIFHFISNKKNNLPSSNNDRNSFINKLSEYIYNKKHFIIIAVSIDQFSELIEQYGERHASALLQNIENFFSKLFPSNEIYSYDNMHFVLIFDNSQKTTGTGPIIDEIVSIFNMPWTIKDKKEKMTVTVSSLLCPEDSESLTEIIDVLRISIEKAQRERTGSIVYGREHIYNREKILDNLEVENRHLELAAKEAMNTRTALEIAEKKNSVFLANVSHEVRTPLHSVIGLCELLLKEDLTPSAKEKAANIKTASTQLFNVFNDLLDYFNVDSGKFQIVEAPYAINEIALEALNIVTAQAKEKNIRLEFVIDDAIPSKLIGDATKIRQVLINLLRNSTRFTNKGSIKLKVNYRPLANDFIELCISVIDTGIGIRTDDLPKIFDNIQTFNTRRSTEEENASLSLALCKRILSLMDGDIKAESTFGEGSTFSFRIPQKIHDFVSIKDAKKNTSYSYKTAKFTETFTAENANILIVDDNRLNREIAKGLLQLYEVNVTTAVSGEECLELVKQNIYDLIFMDHIMPNMDGIDTMNNIRKMSGTYFQTVPIIILTANVSSGNRQDFINQGFAEYIPKPIDISLLDSILRKLLPSELIKEKNVIETDNDKPFGGIMPNIDGMDEQEALSNFKSLEELLSELQKFSQNAPEILGLLEHSLVHNNISLYLMYLTNLTDSAGKFGMKKLVKLGNAHEKAAQNDNIDFLKKNLPFLIQGYKRFLDNLS